MKTIKHLFLAGATLFTFYSNAQNITLGVTGGYQMSTYDYFNFDHPYDGWNAGLTAVYSAQEHFGYSADFLYSRVGGSYIDWDNMAERFETKRLETDMIRFTPKVHYFFNDLEDNFRPTVFVGPSLGILTRAQNTSTGQNIYDNMNPVELSAVAGAGFNYQMVEGLWLHVNANYMLGLTNINKMEIVSPSDLRNNNWGVNLGVAYSLNRMK